MHACLCPFVVMQPFMRLQPGLTLSCRSLHARIAEAFSSCAKQAAATRPGTPEGVLTERREVVQLYRSPGLSASAAAALLRRVRRHPGRTRMCLLPERRASWARGLRWRACCTGSMHPADGAPACCSLCRQA